MNDKAVDRTAPATPGLLNMALSISSYIVLLHQTDPQAVGPPTGGAQGLPQARAPPQAPPHGGAAEGGGQ